MLTESVILGIVGGALGLLLAVWGVEALGALEPQGIPRLAEVRVDPVVIGFTMALGAHQSSVLGLIVREAMVMTLGGWRSVSSRRSS